ncbi:nuclear transport factor 2 family protein [Neolewinella agarilytica]|uniref:Putative lumazine-binding n=1 Tax=Neolewinella agarilytica TaxID=478744 RepID=A0A1H9FCK9_9BACT|nr:nuclear transport factor 2 family protein [Neolewinella agarilytica]SEQ35666.1 Putative lumazine-binding [Neolewinella agarilytica]
MKKVLLFTLLFFAVLATTNAQDTSSDYALVEQTVGYYLDGGTNRDFETLKKAFHESAKIRYLKDGVYHEANCLEFFGKMKPGEKQDRQTRIVSIDVSGYAASAKLEIEYPTFTFVDYMTLMKIDGKWLIMAKVSYARQHPAK